MLLHSGFCPLMEFLGRKVFFVGRDRPHMAEGIFYRPRPITVELVLHGTEHLRAGRDRPIEA